jgi:alpha/beta hydrolase family protein
MTYAINRERRRFFGTAAMTLAAAQLDVMTLAAAQTGPTKSSPPQPGKSGMNASFASLKQINTGVLSIGYAEAGPAEGPAVLLLHGWPYDIHSFVEVTPLLAAAGYRVIVPYLRGYGTTRFLSSTTPRNGQQSVLARDAIDHRRPWDGIYVESARGTGRIRETASGQADFGSGEILIVDCLLTGPRTTAWASSFERCP